jgi:hypothetical protein
LFDKYGSTVSIKVNTVEIDGETIDVDSWSNLDPVTGTVTVKIQKTATNKFAFSFDNHITLKPAKVKYTHDGVSEYIRTYLKSLLYPKGKFLKCQLICGWTKEDLKSFYSRNMKNLYHQKPKDEETVKMVEKALNCEMGWNLSIREFINFAVTCKPFKQKTTIDKWTMACQGASIMESDGDIDEIEELFHESFEENVVYIK